MFECWQIIRRQKFQQPRLLANVSRSLSYSRIEKAGYQSIGSFHSDNVEELIRVPEEKYIPPELPFPEEYSQYSFRIPSSSTSPSNKRPFSNAISFASTSSHLNRQEWTFLNHGAFGLALDVGLQRSHSWRMCLESQPLQYFDRYLLNHLVYGARRMAKFVGARDEAGSLKLREGIAMIGNVTAGMNAVIGGHARCSRSDQVDHGRKVFYFDIAYGSNKKMCQSYHGRENAIEIPFEEDFLPMLQNIQVDLGNRRMNDSDPDSAEVFLKALEAAIYNASNSISKSSLEGSLLILDHITSNTAIHMPISTIAKHAKEKYGMIVAVDGAHGLLSLPLDMPNLLSAGTNSHNNAANEGYVDIYLTNAHKWFSSPRGAALLFCTNPFLRETILRQPAVVSHGIDDGFLSRFLWDGCRDYTAQLSLPVIADFWEQMEVGVVRKEMQYNLLEGVRILISHWHPGKCRDHGDDADAECVQRYSAEAGVTLVPIGLHAPNMVLVRLPDRISKSQDSERKTSTDAKDVQDYLYSRKVEVPVKCIRGMLYVRVSCHVYNTGEEFENLARAAMTFPTI